MAQQPHFTSPHSPGPLHGGNMDPNEIRLRQARAQQQALGTLPPPENSQSPNIAAAPHSDNMNSNAIRLPQTNMAQGNVATANDGSSLDASSIPQPQHSGYNANQTQLPQSLSSAHDVPNQSGQNYFSNTQSHHAPQNYPSGYAPQVCQSKLIHDKSNWPFREFRIPQ